jgi:hypothetical protein
MSANEGFEETRNYREEGAKRAQEISANPRYYEREEGKTFGTLTPEYYTEKAFPHYHEDILSSVAATTAGNSLGNLNHMLPIENSEMNQIQQILSKGKEHSDAAARHHINGDYANAHASLVAAGHSYDTAANVLHGVANRNHQGGRLVGALNMGRQYANGYRADAGRTYASAYKEVLTRKGLL